MNWMPIETAPKDGTDVLVYYEVATVPIVHIAYYDTDEHDLWMDSGFEKKEDRTGWWSYVENSISQHKLEGYHSPTHWMPFNGPEKAADEFN